MRSKSKLPNFQHLKNASLVDSACQCDTQDTQVLCLGEEELLEEGGNGNALQYSGLEKAMDRGDSQATVHWAIKSQK